MAGKMKKIVIPIDTKKTYLECDGQRIELGKINTETFTSVEEDVARGKFAEVHMPLETGILSCEIKITLKTFIDLQDNIYVKHHNTFTLIPAKDLIWNNDEEAAYYVWKGLDESSTFTWHNYLKDWAFTVDWLWRAKNE